MNRKKTVIRFGILIILLCAVVAALRLAASIADNDMSDPAKMVEKYTDASGRPFYRINAGINNAYLLPCDKGWFMVDTGYPGDYERFKKALATMGIGVNSIRWLFITHAHDEHAGFAVKLRKESGCRLIVPEKSLEDLRAGRMVWNGKAINSRIAVVSFLYNFVKKRNLTFPPVELGPKDYILRNDESSFLKANGIDGMFISTPGHSPDSWSIVFSDGRAFCGDGAMNFLNILGAGYRPIFITNEKQTYESLRKLLSFGSKTFYTGHGPAVDKIKIEESLLRYYGK
jgi:glyoxylase-like metal-dependent hydrolase (beta-lactamase superfamily II)